MTDELGKFGKVGFRAYALSNSEWTIVLSRVDKLDAEPRGLFTVAAPNHPEASRELGGRLFARQGGLFASTTLTNIARDCAERLGGDAKLWRRRLDYLIQMVVGDGAETIERDFEGVPGKPDNPRYVFDRRMWERRTVSLFGPGSAGKTTIADGLLVSASSGQEIIPGWTPCRKFVVGNLDWDEGEEETRVRLHAICNAYGVHLEGYHYKHLTRCLADSADDVGRWVVKWGIELLCVQPVKRALRKEPGDPAGPVDELYGVLGELGTTNLLIDHVVGTAIGKQRASREYGSVSKRDNARGSYSVYEQSSEPGKRVVVLRNEKPSSIRYSFAPQAVRIEFDPIDLDESGGYDRISFHPDVVVEETALPVRETAPEKFVRLLVEHGPIETTELCAVGGFKSAYVRQLAKRARKLANVVYGPDGWHVSEEDTTLGLKDG